MQCQKSPGDLDGPREVLETTRSKIIPAETSTTTRRTSAPRRRQDEQTQQQNKGPQNTK